MFREYRKDLEKKCGSRAGTWLVRKIFMEITNGNIGIVPGQPPIPIQALVDSGASDSYLDPSCLGQHHLQPLPHPQPIQLELIDGSTPSTGPIPHYFPTRIRIHGSHTEDITFQVTRLGHF